MFSDPPHTRILTEQPTAVRRTVLRSEDLMDWVPRACAAVAAYLHHHGIAPNGYPFARCHPVLDGRVEVEAGFPVAAPITGHPPIEASVLPGGPALVVCHTGPEEKVGLAYQAIDDWFQSESAVPVGDGWEIYHDLPTCDQVGRRIEVVQPVSFAGTL